MNKKGKVVRKKHKKAIERVKTRIREAKASAKAPRRTPRTAAKRTEASPVEA